MMSHSPVDVTELFGRAAAQRHGARAEGEEDHVTTSRLRIPDPLGVLEYLIEALLDDLARAREGLRNRR